MLSLLPKQRVSHKVCADILSQDGVSVANTISIGLIIYLYLTLVLFIYIFPVFFIHGTAMHIFFIQ